ncbi:MAG TPA: peptidase [Thermoanaerobaculia bacterium]|nr:peptidase [Thermoanaerobaculia bacterium]HUM30407.1 peptidase [Thermoanaerobaculia bacterium]HXK68582.1 peptidase [Thermoanaerobaculia bacterium]
MRSVLVILMMTLALGGCKPKSEEGSAVPERTIADRMARYVPVEIAWNRAALSEEDHAVLAKLVEAARIMDDIFLRQVDPRNPEWLAGITDPVTRDYFWLNFGPWDRLDGDEPFIGTVTKPAGAGFYPPDLTKEDFEAYLESHPEEKEALIDPYTIVRREGDKLVAIPYSEAFKEELAHAADLLKEAAALTKNASLKSFLLSRAGAFMTDKYTPSERDWMDIRDSVIDPTIGPYEVYEDGLMSYKTAFEAFISIVEMEESKKLDMVADHLEDMEANLPLPKELASPPRGSESPIRVVNLVYSGGDTKAGVQTIAYNLPNDEEVRKEKGSKKVMMKNVIEAKFRGILKPIAEELVWPDQAASVSPEGFFNNTLFHEISHGLGPGILEKNGEKTTVSKELKELYPAIEEAKADVMGLYNVLYLVDKGVLPEALKTESPRTYLAGMFRSIRFGVEEAHGQGVALEFNYLKEKGAFQRSDCGHYTVNEETFPEHLKSLLEMILLVEAKGDYQGAADLLKKYGHLTPQMKKDLERLKDIPVDIRPVFILP